MKKVLWFLCLTPALLAFVSTSWGQINIGPETPSQNIVTVAGPITWNGSGADDFWSNPDNWIGGFVPNGSTAEAVVGATAPAVANTDVSLATLTVNVDGVVEVGTSRNFEITMLNNAGTVTTGNNSDFGISGTVDNSGSIDIVSTGNQTDLELNSNVTLTGGGAVTLRGSNAGITDVTSFSNATLTIDDQTIQGEGNIGRGGTTLVNQATGLIDANVDGGTLLIDADGGGLTNSGTLRASGGGTLELRDAGAGDFANTGGTIEALDDSEVLLTNNARIVGGILDTDGTGQFRVGVSQNAFLENLTLSGSLVADNNSDTGISGTINNTGSIEIVSTGNQTDLELNSTNVTLTGGGIVTLSGSNAGINDDLAATQTLTIGDQTIQGQGNIGRNASSFVNEAEGLIDANVDGGTLIIDAGSFTNSGTLRASNGGILELRDAGSADFDNADGTIEALNDSEVLLTNNARILGGVLSTTGTGQFRVGVSQNAFLENLTLNGSLVADNNSDIHVAGTINNTGAIEIVSTGSPTDLETSSAAVTLNGGGTVTLSGNNAGIADGTSFGSDTITIADQTIQGVGNVGRNSINFVNQADGLIDANVEDGTLVVDAGNSFTNTGTLSASGGGILELRDTDFANTAGTIEALNGSEVLLTTNTSIVDGTLSTDGTGQFRVGVSQNAFLEDLTLNGSLVADNNSDTGISGTINNTGSIQIVSTLNQTDLEVAAGGATLTGGGTVTLSGGNAGINDVINGTQTLTIGDQTIQGVGNIGRNTTNFVNQADGLINANVEDGTLVVDASGSFINSGTLRASNGGILELRDAGAGDFANAGGTIEALNGSEVLLTNNADIVGGVLSTDGTGQFRVGVSQNAFLEDLTLNGSLVADNNSDTGISGTINNTGSIQIVSTLNQTDLEVAAGGATLTGGGTVTLSGGNAGINDVINGTQTLTIGDQTIQGVGNIGRNTTNIINNGTILANNATAQLTVDVAGADFDNDGTLQVSNGATLQVVGDLTGSSTATLVGDGTITATGGDIQHAGLITAGDDSIGNLILDANVAFDATTDSQFEIGGTSAGLFDVLTVNDDLSLDGLLSLFLTEGFTPDEDDTFEIISSLGSLDGSFTNVLNGDTLLTADGLGEFTVNFGSESSFGANSVVLSNFSSTAVPEPGSVSLLMLSGLVLIGRRRREI